MHLVKVAPRQSCTPSKLPLTSCEGRDHAAGEQVFIDYDGGVGLRLAWEMVHTYGPEAFHSNFSGVVSLYSVADSRRVGLSALWTRHSVIIMSSLCRSCRYVPANQGFVPNNMPAYAGRRGARA